MIEIISGEKGKGKTKELLNKVNTSITSATGNIVYLDKSQKHMYELNNKIRLINVNDFLIDNCDEFLGFICGVISQDHDLEEMYLDSFLTIASIDSDELLNHAIQKLDVISEKYNVKFILSVLLLDRVTLSQKNGWVDAQGRAYVLYPLAGLAADLQSSISSVTRALRELEAARLIERRSNGFSKPNQIFLGVPQTVQKCAIGMVKNEQPDCSKVSNPIAQNCTPNQINKNDLRWNKINRTKEAYGRYQNVFLENYSELKIEIAELDALVEELSAYMQSTGRKYVDHAATLRSWAARKRKQQKPGTGIPDYTYNEEESL